MYLYTVQILYIHIFFNDNMEIVLIEVEKVVFLWLVRRQMFKITYGLKLFYFNVTWYFFRDRDRAVPIIDLTRGPLILFT